MKVIKYLLLKLALLSLIFPTFLVAQEEKLMYPGLDEEGRAYFPVEKSKPPHYY